MAPATVGVGLEGLQSISFAPARSQPSNEEGVAEGPAMSFVPAAARKLVHAGRLSHCKVMRIAQTKGSGKIRKD